MEQLAMSRPDISFRYRVNGSEKLFTTGKPLHCLLMNWHFGVINHLISLALHGFRISGHMKMGST